jgi:hypothetical protein
MFRMIGVYQWRSSFLEKSELPQLPVLDDHFFPGECGNPLECLKLRHQGKICTVQECRKPPVEVIRTDQRGADYLCEAGHEYRREN